MDNQCTTISEMKEQLIELLELKQYDDFFSGLPKVILEMTEKERQELLVDIIDFHYDRNLFSKFKKAFDLIIGAKLNLNFNIDHWASTFLSLVVLRAPSFQLFEYFLKKGADINFIGDTLFFEEGESLEFEKKHLLYGQFQTCVDFTQIKLNDLLTTDYNFDVPGKRSEGDWRDTTHENITISKSEYLYLYEQSEFLFDIINTDRLFDHMKRIGGKTYEELKKEGKHYKKQL